MKAQVGETLRAPRRFDLVGLRGSGLEHAHVELRTRRLGGKWTRWTPVHAGGDHRPNGGTGEHASDPILVDGARELQLRAPGQVPRDLRLHFVAVPALAKRAGARAVAKIRATANTRQLSGVPVIVPRAQWGAKPPKAAPAFGEVQIAFVHHTVSLNDYSPEAAPGMVLAIQAYHQNTQGWNDIGYNFLVDKYGVIYEGRGGGVDQPVIGAQAQGWNDDSSGIAFIGDSSSVAATPGAIEAISRLIAWKLSVHGAPVAGAVNLVSGGGSENKYPAGQVVSFNRISGHRDGGKTACPGNALYSQLGQIRARAAQIAPEFAQITGRLTMSRSASAVRYGETLTLTGQLLRLDGSLAAGAPVTIQKRGSNGWVSLTRAFTDSNGAYVATLPWRASGRVRVRAEIDGGQAVSSGAQVECVPLLSSIKRARVGNSSTVRGKVRPADTFKVLVERNSGGKYRRVGTFSVKARRSAFKAKLPLRKPGRYRLTPIVKTKNRVFKGKSVLLRAVR